MSKEPKTFGKMAEPKELFAMPEELIKPVPAEKKKDGNPKDAIGSKKVGLCLVPTYPQYVEALAFVDGGCKYGPHNYRVYGVRASVYANAAKRHIDKWFEGEQKDGDSGVHHLGHARACLSILLDAELLGKLHDDRPPKYPDGWMDQLDKDMAEILAGHEDHKSPYTQKGVEAGDYESK